MTFQLKARVLRKVNVFYLNQFWFIRLVANGTVNQIYSLQLFNSLLVVKTAINTITSYVNNLLVLFNTMVFNY